MYKIYNKSSENMNEVKNDSIDLIITSPPYNISTSYGNYKDSLSFDQYFKLLSNVLNECSRVIKQKGFLIIEVADTTLINGLYVQLSALITSICLKSGFKLYKRDINFIKTKNKIELADHSVNKYFSSRNNTHSNCHQILFFSKALPDKIAQEDISYMNYEESKEHPCPFPKSHFSLLDKYFKKGGSVLDPFMGTATLGVEVLKRSGNFYGYEIVKEFYDAANNKLSKFKQ